MQCQPLLFDPFSGWAAPLLVETRAGRSCGGTEGPSTSVPWRTVKEKGMGQGYDLLCLSWHTSVITQVTLSLCTLHTNNIKAARGRFGAGLPKLGLLNFLRSTPAAGAHRPPCCPAHIPCIPIPLTILRPGSEPRPDCRATEGTFAEPPRPRAGSCPGVNTSEPWAQP